MSRTGAVGSQVFREVSDLWQGIQILSPAQTFPVGSLYRGTPWPKGRCKDTCQNLDTKQLQFTMLNGQVKQLVIYGCKLSCCSLVVIAVQPWNKMVINVLKWEHPHWLHAVPLQTFLHALYSRGREKRVRQARVVHLSLKPAFSLSSETTGFAWMAS